MKGSWTELEDMNATLDAMRSPSLQKGQKRANSALRGAAATNELDKLKKAIREDADIDARDAHGQTAAHLAVTNGNYECFKELITTGIDTDLYGEELVIIAVEKVHSLTEDDAKFSAYKNCLNLLTQLGIATPNLIDEIQHNIHEEAKQQQMELRKQEAQQRKQEAFNAAIIAIGNMNSADLEAALGAENIVNLLDNEGDSLADHAIKEASAECLERILDSGFDIATHGKKLMDLLAEKLLEYENNADLMLELDSCAQLLCKHGVAMPEDNVVQQTETSVTEAAVADNTQNTSDDSDPDNNDLETQIYLQNLAAMTTEEVNAVSKKDRPAPPQFSPITMLSAAKTDREQTRQLYEKSRSFSGQESETPLICRYTPGLFITAGGYKIPKYGDLRDPSIRIWNTEGQCLNEFDGSMTIREVKDGIYGPDGLCMISDNILAVSYGTSVVQIYSLQNQQLQSRLDLQGEPSLSPRGGSMTSRSSFRKKPTAESPVVAIPSSGNAPTDSPVLSRARSGSNAGLSPRKNAEIPVVSPPLTRGSRSASLSQPGTPEMSRNRAGSIGGISPRSVKLASVEVDLCHWPTEGLSLLATTFNNAVKTWDIERSICLSQLKDKRAVQLVKIRPVNHQGLFGLDNQGNGFIWDNREKSEKKSVGFFSVATNKTNPCIATFDQGNVIGISYRGMDGQGLDIIRLWDIRKYTNPCLVPDQKLPSCKFGATFCAMNDEELAFASASTVNYHSVPGHLVGIYHLRLRTTRYVDLITQEPNALSPTLPNVIAMEKIAEHRIALGLNNGKKGSNTLKISHTARNNFNSEELESLSLKL